ncbi:unnamed protein product [Allacma fusca]|uniref:Uncharacterized protein n=1 Tax=Allacma fusca TaxID=39272 RepID=A0A8J2NRP0_9HEXA|nr:unnamed protein product [Allacma fusca]
MQIRPVRENETVNIFNAFNSAVEGYVLEPDEPRNYTRGAHGYDACQPSMRAFFVAMGPLFKNNSVLEPFDNIDLYPLICHMLSIEPRPHNGSLDHVLPLLICQKNDFSQANWYKLPENKYNFSPEGKRQDRAEKVFLQEITLQSTTTLK